jgi:hypothetical protein
MFADMDIVKDATFGAGKDNKKALTYLRDALAVGLYLDNKEVTNIFNKQKTRMAVRIGKVGAAVSCQEAEFNPKELDLEDEWNKYMTKEWNDGVGKLKTWMSGKSKLMNDILKCGKKETKEAEDTEQVKHCKMLSFIDTEWQKIINKGTLDKAPWEQTTGQKRPASQSPPGSDIEKPEPKSQKPSKKKESGPSSK